MIVIDKLRTILEQRFDMTAIHEPNNAMSRRSVRIAQAGMRINPLSKEDMGADFTPYELLLTLQISFKLSGGNAGDYLTHQIMEHGILFQCALIDDLMLIKDIDEDLPLLRDHTASNGGGFFMTRLVGDAEITDSKRIASGYEGGAKETFSASGEPYIYTEVWSCTLVMTLHRLFNNPRLKQVTYIQDAPACDVLIVPPESETQKEP